MENFQIFAFITCVLVSLQQTEARPGQELSRFNREKRTSDQRLAELETLFALSKMSGKLVTVPIGFGKIDPSKLGRRRRSIDLLLHQLVSDLSAKDKLSNEIGQSKVKEREDGEHESNTDVQKPARNTLVNYELELLSHPHLPVKLLAK